MRFSLGSVLEMDDIRRIVRSVRSLGAIPEDDGYYDIKIRAMDYQHLLEDVKTQELLDYMTDESRARAKAGGNNASFQGIYGALVTIWEPQADGQER